MTGWLGRVVGGQRQQPGNLTSGIGNNPDVIPLVGGFRPGIQPVDAIARDVDDHIHISGQKRIPGAVQQDDFRGGNGTPPPGQGPAR